MNKESGEHQNCEREALRCHICDISEYANVDYYVEHLSSDNHKKLKEFSVSKMNQWKKYIEHSAKMAERRKNLQLQRFEQSAEATVRELAQEIISNEQKIILKKKLKEKLLLIEILSPDTPELVEYKKSTLPYNCSICKFESKVTSHWQDHLCDLTHLQNTYKTEDVEKGESEYKKMKSVSEKIIKEIEEAKRNKSCEGIDDVNMEEGGEKLGMDSFVVTHFYCDLCEEEVKSENVSMHSTSLRHYENMKNHMRKKAQDTD